MADPVDPPSPVVQCVTTYRAQADQAKRNRMLRNQQNMDCFHLKQDWSHKVKGQSQEFLAKTATAVEQFVSFIQQGLLDKGNWFSVEMEPGMDPSKQRITAQDIFKLVLRQLKKAEFYTLVADVLKLGSLQALMIVKIHGRMVEKYTFKSEKKYTFKGIKKVLKKEIKHYWQLQIDMVRAEDYYPDPSGEGLYECQDIEMDLWRLKEIAHENPEDYDLYAIEQLQASIDAEQQSLRASETDQNQTTEMTARRRVRITECWGTILDPSTGSVIAKNSVCAVANDRFLIRPIKENQLWHGESPYVASPILRVPGSVWHKALMDAPTQHNRALNEVYNLMLDAGLQSVFGVRQIREHWLDDPSQIANGIPAGTTLRINSMAPIGGKVIERCDTSTEFAQSVNIFNITQQEFHTSAFTNDLRMGNLPDRQVKATEIVASNQAITGVSNGIVKVIEDSFVAKVLRKAWLTCAQHLNDYSQDEVRATLGEEKALLLANLTPEDIFAETAQGFGFQVFGLSTTLNKINDFKKWTALLQTISASEPLLAAFSSRFDMSLLLGEIMKSLDLDPEKLAGRPPEVSGSAQNQLPPNPDSAMAQVLARMQQQGAGQGRAGQAPSPVANQTQIPQAGASRRVETGVTVPRSQILEGMTTPEG